MSTAAALCSVLFERPKGRTERDVPAIFSDLNVGQVLTAVAGRDLTRFFGISPVMSSGLRYQQSRIGSRFGMRRSAGSASGLRWAVADYEQGRIAKGEGDGHPGSLCRRDYAC